MLHSIWWLIYYFTDKNLSLRLKVGAQLVGGLPSLLGGEELVLDAEVRVEDLLGHVVALLDVVRVLLDPAGTVAGNYVDIIFTNGLFQ